MNEKEKAFELIKKFQNIEMLKDWGGMDFEIARCCALISIEEVIFYSENESPSHVLNWLKGIKHELSYIENPLK